jgi:hypothetical protein
MEVSVQHLNFKNRAMMTSLVFLGVAAASSLVISCAEKREAKLSEEASRTIFSRTLFDDKDVEVHLEGAELDASKKEITNSKTQAYSVSAENHSLKVTSVDADQKIQFMFRNLVSENLTSAKKTKINLRVTKEYITGFLVSSASDGLPLSLKYFSITEGSEVLTPIFKYKVEGYGQLKPKKNELGQETSALDLISCDWSEATHVKLTPTADSRLLVESPFNNNLDKPIYLYDKLAEKSFTLLQLKDLFGIDVDALKSLEIENGVYLKLTHEDTLSLISDDQVIGTVAVKCAKSNLTSESKQDFDPKIELVDTLCDESHLSENLVQISRGTIVQNAKVEEEKPETSK